MGDSRSEGEKREGAAREGITVVVAKPGTYVPGIDTTIQVGKIRGIESFGMMCSEREIKEREDFCELSRMEVLPSTTPLCHPAFSK